MIDDMSLFQIDRGHDGPARVGRIKVGEKELKTPVLAGPSSIQGSHLDYGTISRLDSNAESPMLVTFSFFSRDDSTDLASTPDSLLIPPVPLALSELGHDAIALILEHQLEFITQSLPPDVSARVLVRIPSDCSEETLSKYVPQFVKLGVLGAALSFDGLLGMNDLNTLRIRALLPLQWLVVALGRVSPSFIPLLHYMGFDVMDMGHALEAAAQRERLWPTSTEHVSTVSEARFCPCPSCSSIAVRKSFPTSALELHNTMVYHLILSESQSAMRSGQLRWLVESMTHSSPSNATILRMADTSLSGFMEEFTPTSGPKHLPLIGPESYNSPAVKRFRERVSERYTPPEVKSVVLLLPCSARKPYSDSKTHRRFLSAIDSVPGIRGELAEVILTSPLGVVPRELERMFPASSYDIPVTGTWDFEETSIASQALVTHLTKFSEDSVVVAHVSGGYMDIVKMAEPEIRQGIIYTTVDQSPTRSDSLEALKETLRDVHSGSGKTNPPSYLQYILRSTADYQFGRGAGEILVPDDARIRGKPYGTILCKVHGEQVCAFIGDTGMLSLTLAGGKLIRPLERSWVRFEGDRAKGGSIFAVGIHKADTSIRPGDEVIVLNSSDEVVAVGKSEMSGREMCELTRGRAVSIRHKLEA
ncbi:MAG: DUF5591 domain-containing protein [Candidatus Thorarchaeota archaeon]